MKAIVIILLGLMAIGAQAEKREFSRYQSIVDRQMFGQLPPNFDPTKPPSEVSRAEQKELTKEQEKLQSAIRFSVIQVSPDGDVRVGFTDNSDPKAPRHYVLKVGETRDGWTVKEADAAEQSMTIEKEGIEVSLKIGGDSGKDKDATRRNESVNNRPSALSRPGSNLLSGGTLRQRRLQRQQEAAEKAAAEKAAQEEKAAAEKAERAAEKAERDELINQQRQQLMAIQEELKKRRDEKDRKENDQNEDN